MRLHEFANAEAQLGLLRTILDNTWSAIAQQAEQQKRSDAERLAQAKLKSRAKKPSKISVYIPTPPLPTPIKPPAPIAKQPTPASSQPNPNANTCSSFADVMTLYSQVCPNLTSSSPQPFPLPPFPSSRLLEPEDLTLSLLDH
jgi:hypothetical protein